MKCYYCGKEWTNDALQNRCPFCNTNMMPNNTSVREVFKWIVGVKGIKILQNGGLINALISDLSKDEDKERQWLKTAFFTGMGIEFYKRFKQCQGIFDELEIHRFQTIIEDQGFAREYSSYVTEAFLYASGSQWKDEDIRKADPVVQHKATDDGDSEKSDLERQLKREVDSLRKLIDSIGKTASSNSDAASITAEELEKQQSNELRKQLKNGNSGGVELFFDSAVTISGKSYYRQCIKLVYLCHDKGTPSVLPSYWRTMTDIESASKTNPNLLMIGEYSLFKASFDYFERGDTKRDFVYSGALDWNDENNQMIKKLDEFINNSVAEGIGYVYSYATKSGRTGTSPNYWFAYRMGRSRFVSSQKPQRIKVYFNGDGTWTTIE